MHSGWTALSRCVLFVLGTPEGTDMARRPVTTDWLSTVLQRNDVYVRELPDAILRTSFSEDFKTDRRERASQSEQPASRKRA